MIATFFWRLFSAVLVSAHWSPPVFCLPSSRTYRWRQPSCVNCKILDIEFPSRICRDYWNCVGIDETDNIKPEARKSKDFWLKNCIRGLQQDRELDTESFPWRKVSGREDHGMNFYHSMTYHTSAKAARKTYERDSIKTKAGTPVLRDSIDDNHQDTEAAYGWRSHVTALLKLSLVHLKSTIF